MRFKIGMDGLDSRKCAAADSAIGVLRDREMIGGSSRELFWRELRMCHRKGASVGALLLQYDQRQVETRDLLQEALGLDVLHVHVPLPEPVFCLMA